MTTGNNTYFKGDKAEYTGKKVDLYGGIFDEVLMLEGVNKGKLMLKKEVVKTLTSLK